MSEIEVLIWLIGAATYVDAALTGQWLTSMIPESARNQHQRADMFMFTIVPVENILVLAALYAYWFWIPKWTR